jgi:hypothetical protein
VTLEEDVAQWARIEAALCDTSVSRLLGSLLKERMAAQDAYEKSMRRSLARKPFLHSGGRYLTREEVHDRRPSSLIQMSFSTQWRMPTPANSRQPGTGAERYGKVAVGALASRC